MLKESLRFFDDKELAEEVNLTKEEIKIFENFEFAVLYDNGLKNLNGGYSKVTIYDVDYDDEGNEILVCEVECGEQDMGNGHSSCDKWQINYNRKTQKFEER
jgi:hypothetical protein